MATTIATKHRLSGNAFWNNDCINQGGAWIQTPTKEGIVFWGTFSTGHVWYQTSGPNFQGANHRFLIYSRDQFASVVGGVAQDQIQPTRYAVNFPALTYPLPGGWGGSPHQCIGMAYDPVDRKLYIAIAFASIFPTFSSSSVTVIYVYQVR